LLWDNAEKCIKDLIGKMNQSNLPTIVRGRDILAGSLIATQCRSQNNANVYSALVAAQTDDSEARFH